MGYVKRREIEALEPREEPPMEVLGWIPVSERLPEEGVVVLAYLPKQADVESGVYAAMLSKLQTLKGTFSTSFGFGFEATHWMPLPSPPDEAT